MDVSPADLALAASRQVNPSCLISICLSVQISVCKQVSAPKRTCLVVSLLSLDLILMRFIIVFIHVYMCVGIHSV